jgi:hypothetical protein
MDAKTVEQAIGLDQDLKQVALFKNVMQVSNRHLLQQHLLQMAAQIAV